MKLFYMLLGCVLYSFADVVSIRLPRKMNFITDHSRCMHCQHILKWYDLIPVVSYICLKGRCRYCHTRIDRKVFYVELLGLFAGYIFTDHLFGFLYSMFLLIIALIDLDSMNVYLISLIPLILLDGLSYNSLSIYEHLIGMLLFSLPMLMINYIKKDSFGGGDIELVIILGFYLGIHLIYCMSYALLFALLYHCWKKLDNKHFPFIPFIYIGFITYSFISYIF